MTVTSSDNSAAPTWCAVRESSCSTWLRRPTGVPHPPDQPPCVFVISTSGGVASLAWGARRGLLVKGGASLEMLGRTTVVAFDKTGILTEGGPRVIDVRGLQPEAIMRWCCW